MGGEVVKKPAPFHFFKGVSKTLKVSWLQNNMRQSRKNFGK